MRAHANALIFHAMLRGYQTGEGCSGTTYLQGFVAPVETCLPAVVFFENVKGVAQKHSVVHEDGTTSTPPKAIEAHQQGEYTALHIHIHMYLFTYLCIGRRGRVHRCIRMNRCT